MNIPWAQRRMTMVQHKNNRTAILLPLVALLILDVNSSDSCDRHHVDGCSVSFLRNSKFVQTYTPACNRHDVCYSCGVRHGIARIDCDSAFRDDVMTICQQIVDLEVDVCSFVALTAYRAVRFFGSTRYNQTGRLWCHEDFVQDCLP